MDRIFIYLSIIIAGLAPAGLLTGIACLLTRPDEPPQPDGPKQPALIYSWFIALSVVVPVALWYPLIVTENMTTMGAIAVTIVLAVSIVMAAAFVGKTGRKRLSNTMLVSIIPFVVTSIITMVVLHKMGYRMHLGT